MYESELLNTCDVILKMLTHPPSKHKQTNETFNIVCQEPSRAALCFKYNSAFG